MWAVPSGVSPDKKTWRMKLAFFLLAFSLDGNFIQPLTVSLLWAASLL